MLYESQYYGITSLGDTLMHHGVKGQKHGIRRWQNHDGSLTPEGYIHYGVGQKSRFKSVQDLSNHMRTFKYAEFTKLKSAKEVEDSKSGSCHDQVMYEYENLKAMGKDPKALFMIEYDEKTGQGGTTHSIVYYEEGGKINYIENAWGGKEGIRQFSNTKQLQNYFKSTHKNGEFGNNKRFPSFDIVEFDPSKHKPGEDLQQFIDKIYDEEEKRSGSDYG